MLLAQTLLDVSGFDDVALFLATELRADGLTAEKYCDWLCAQAMARLGDRIGALELLRGVHELVEPNGNRLSLERVYLARTLLAAAEGLTEEAGDALLLSVTEFGPHGQCEFLISLWRGREAQLAERLRHAPGQYLDDVVAELDRLGCRLRTPVGSQ